MSHWRLREQFHEVTSADGRLWRTLRAVFVPGKLTDKFFRGRRGLYAWPVRVFLVLNVVLFFVVAGSNGSILKGPLGPHYSAALYGETAQRPSPGGSRPTRWRRRSTRAPLRWCRPWSGR